VTVWLEVGGKRVRVELGATGSQTDGLSGGIDTGPMECSVDGRAISVDVRPLEPGVMSLLVTYPDGAGRQYRCVLDGHGVVISGRRFGFEVDDPRSLQGRRGAGAGTEGPRPLKAPMPGRVVRMLVEVGEEVAEGQGMVVIEAMKMQNELKSPKAGRVMRVGVAVGDTVGSGDVLVVVE
jgi:acetyl/propionyl-CoA carboxylase alpha subunit